MEMETHHEEANDPASKLIGLQTAVIAILLSIFTILAHRAHTETIMEGNKSSNSWAHYQAKRIRAYQIEMNTGLIKLLAPNAPETAVTLDEYAKQSKKYEKDLEEIKAEAESAEKAEGSAHHQGTLFDLAEGLLEIAMILSSLYFLTKKKLFPSLGLLLAVGGIAVGIMGLLGH